MQRSLTASRNTRYTCGKNDSSFEECNFIADIPQTTHDNEEEIEFQIVPRESMEDSQIPLDSNEEFQYVEKSKSNFIL
jgi:hypothetical protein